MNSSAGDVPHYQTPEQIAAHIDELMAEAEAMLEGPVSQHAPTEVEHLKTRLAAARKGLWDIFGDAHRQVSAGARFTDETIRAHPYATLTVALGLGLIVGRLWPRRHALA